MGTPSNPGGVVAFLVLPSNPGFGTGRLTASSLLAAFINQGGAASGFCQSADTDLVDEGGSHAGITGADGCGSASPRPHLLLDETLCFREFVIAAVSLATVGPGVWLVWALVEVISRWKKDAMNDFAESVAVAGACMVREEWARGTGAFTSSL
jgi:hypothetical protein